MEMPWMREGGPSPHLISPLFPFSYHAWLCPINAKFFAMTTLLLICVVFVCSSLLLPPLPSALCPQDSPSPSLPLACSPQSSSELVWVLVLEALRPVEPLEGNVGVPGALQGGGRLQGRLEEAKLQGSW